MSAPELAAGDIVDDKYTIQAVLRHGGPLATYRAVIGQDRQVALKFYDPRLRSCTGAVKALARYETITSELPTTLIVHVVEGGEDPATGAFYTVTNFDPNPSLAELVEWSPLSASEVVAVVRNLARALDAVHAHGISHLALKPTNLFVGPGSAYTVRVVDFGMSHVRGALSAPRERGPWSFWLAPEQSTNPALGGPAADVFTTALIAFYALTGKSYWRSFQSSTPDYSAWKLEIVGAHVPVSQRAAELSISLDCRLDSAFARALAVKPEDRFRTVGQFAEALAAAAMDPATRTFVAQDPIAKEVERPAPSSTSAVVLAPSVKTDAQAPSVTSEASMAVEAPGSLTRMNAVRAAFQRITPKLFGMRAVAVPTSGMDRRDSQTPFASAQLARRFRSLWMPATVAGALIAGALWVSSGAKSSPAPAAAAPSSAAAVTLSTEVPEPSARAIAESDNAAASTNDQQIRDPAAANDNTVHSPATVRPRRRRASPPEKKCGKLLLKPCQ